ncbi:MAG TPA: nucleoside triphosphate pyrophosphohydrolase [Promineifilum sp.]|nr:nucleoside triphosphate pyrophosphohydrolase [Promineifilum sp.]HNS38742.1 nucleoside triphosphate pyrophosphohydrolase [Promineifilum sp.]
MTIITGLSLVQPAVAQLGIEILGGLQLFDAAELEAMSYPPINPDVPALLIQVRDRALVGKMSLLLMSVYPAGHQVALVRAGDDSEPGVEWLPLSDISDSEYVDDRASLYVPPLPLKSSLPALAESVSVLRQPGGCPWDQEQTPQSLREGFLEEAYEVLAALDTGDTENLREELGDLLYHVVMQTRMAAEAGQFTLSDVLAGIEAKLKRRHPHVWGDWQVSNSAQVLRNWEIIKQQEKAGQPKDQTPSALDGILANLPALARSQKIQKKVAGTGFDWPDISGVYDKLAEEVQEVRQATTPEELQLELGDVLFVVANLGLWLNVDAESALREANERFGRRFRQVERLAADRDLTLSVLPFDALDALWEEAKAILAQTTVADTVQDEPS